MQVQADTELTESDVFGFFLSWETIADRAPRVLGCSERGTKREATEVEGQLQHFNTVQGKWIRLCSSCSLFLFVFIPDNSLS